MAKRIKCPDKKWFERLVDGKVSAEQEAKLSAHLDQCKFCQRIMDQLNSLEDLVGETKKLPRPTLATSSDSFRDRLAEIKSKEPSSQSSFAARGYMDVMPWIDESEEHLGRIGEFELLGFVGRGGMGVVFKAMDTKLQRLVALKLMSPQMLVDEAAKERFLREARSAAVISHANVVTVHAVDESRGLPYLVMEFVEGASLESQLQSEKPIPIPQIITISTQMARGLKAAHEKGVLHRDIKPANIMLVSRNSQVKIADFGLACTAEGSKLTRTGLLVGTPDFISPEQANSKPADPRSDLFSLGCVIYAMCSGESPFTGPTMMSTLDNVRSREPEPLGQINPELPSWLVRLVEQLLKKDPEQRMQSADDVIRRFENSETNTSLPFVDTRTSSAQISSQIRERQNSFVRAMLLLTASVVLAVAMISWWVYVGHQQAASSETVAGREEQIKSEPISQVRIEDDEFAENAASEVEDNPHLEEAEAHDDNEFDELHSFHVNSFAGIVNAIQSEHESMEIIVDVDEPLLLTAPIQIEGKLISLVAPDDNPAEMVVEFWDRAAIVAENSILRTENIQFEAVSKLEQDDEAFEVVEPLIHMGGGKLIIQNCIAYSNRPSPLFEVQGADIDMIGSGIATSGVAFFWSSEREQEFSCEDSAIVAPVSVAMEDLKGATFHVENSSFFSEFTLALNGASFPPRQLYIHAENSLFACHSALIGIEFTHDNEDDRDRQNETVQDDLEKVLTAITVETRDNSFPDILLETQFDEPAVQLPFSNTQLTNELEKEGNQMAEFEDFDFLEGLVDRVESGKFKFSEIDWDQFDKGTHPDDFGLLPDIE